MFSLSFGSELEDIFRRDAKTNTFATANPSCGGRDACAYWAVVAARSARSITSWAQPQESVKPEPPWP